MKASVHTFMVAPAFLCANNQYDELYQAYLNKKFTILRVVKVDDPPKTDPMF